MSHISNLLSNIQSGLIVRHHVVHVKRTKFNLEVLKLLEEQGFINGIFISEQKLNSVSVFLKYYDNKPVFKKLKIISLPSKRIYVNYNTIVKYLVKNGFFVISTSHYGLVCSEDFLKKSDKLINVGGELLFEIIF